MAGILDALFSPSTYGTGQGGLLDLINSQMGYQPSAGFGQQQPQQPSPPPAIAQASPLAIGGYQMPRLGAADLYNPAQVNLPNTAQPTQGVMPQAPAQAQGGMPPAAAAEQGQLPPALGGNQFGGNFGAGLQNFVNTPGGLIGKILGGVTGFATGQRTDPLGMQQQNLGAQYAAFRQTLQQNGYSPQEASSRAMLAIMNPEAAKTVIGEALTNREQFKTIKDALGGEHGYWINEREQTMKPADAGGGGPGSPLGSGPSVLASGVKQYDPNLTGEDYLKQFSPEVQAATKAYMNGDVMPTGNPRQNGIANFAKTVAQKYGADMGIPVSDALYAAKRKMQTDIASSSNSSMGGILSNGKSAFEHLKTYSDKLADVGNINIGGPGGGLAANVYNGVTNYAGSSEQRGKVAAATEAGLKYGQESTKFYSGSGGGAEERMAALRANDANSKSGAEQAGFLQAERDLMVGRMEEKAKHIRDVMGEQYLQDHPVFTKDLQDTIAKIDANIARLKTGTPAASSAGVAQAAGGLPAGWSVKVH